MQKDDNNNIFSAVLTGSLFTVAYFGSQLLAESFLLQIVLGIIAAVGGYLIAHTLKEKRSGTRYLLAALVVIVSIIGIYLFYLGGVSLRKTQVSEVLNGVWESDSTDGVKLRFRIQGNLMTVGMAPDYIEKRYSMQISGDKLKLFDDKVLKFSWILMMPDSSSFVISTDKDRVIMKKVPDPDLTNM